VQINQAIALAKAENLEMTPSIVRSNLEKLGAFTGQGPELAQVNDEYLTCDDRQIGVRIYAPVSAGPLDVMVYFHGGGHMCGSVELYDPICRRLAASSGVIVISVEYRLAPEHPYPAAIDDGYQICSRYKELLTAHCLSGKLFVAGDSAGGSMTSVLAQQSQHDDALKIAGQILIYPALDYTMNTDSHHRLGRGFLLEREKISWYFNHYFQNNEDMSAMSPLFKPVGKELPPALILCAGFDPLCDEAHAYHDKLVTAGAVSEIYQFDHMIHAFINLHQLVPEQCDLLYLKIAEFIRD
jgi:acetyl esterase/lipase